MFHRAYAPHTDIDKLASVMESRSVRRILRSQGGAFIACAFSLMVSGCESGESDTDAILKSQDPDKMCATLSAILTDRRKDAASVHVLFSLSDKLVEMGKQATTSPTVLEDDSPGGDVDLGRPVITRLIADLGRGEGDYQIHAGSMLLAIYGRLPSLFEKKDRKTAIVDSLLDLLEDLSQSATEDKRIRDAATRALSEFRMGPSPPPRGGR